MADKKAAKLKEQPESPMMISTLRETMNAFMPNQYASVLDESGYEIVTADAEQRLAIIDAIDRTSETLFNKINVEHSGSMSARLVPPPNAQQADQADSLEQVDDSEMDGEDDENFAEQTAMLEKNLGRDLG